MSLARLERICSVIVVLIRSNAPLGVAVAVPGWSVGLPGADSDLGGQLGALGAVTGLLRASGRSPRSSPFARPFAVVAPLGWEPARSQCSQAP